MLHQVLKFLAATFFAIAIAVHIYGLLFPYSSESIVSHLAHILSYSVCLFTVSKRVKRAHFIYFIAAMYPIYYHAGCARSADGSFNAICVFVVLFMTAITFWMFYNHRYEAK
jgi:hypothetical protein